MPFYRTPIPVVEDDPQGRGRNSPATFPKQILIVDDEPLIRQLYIRALTDAGYEADGAENGSVAWMALQDETYDLLITDNEMPVLNGMDLLKMLHAARLMLPVILATATFPEDEFIHNPWLRPDITLLKPFTLPEFLHSVAVVLSPHDSINPGLVPPPLPLTRPSPGRLRV